MSTLWTWILAALVAPLLVGFLVNLNGEAGLAWLFYGFIYVVALVIGFGAYLIVKLKGKPKGVITAIVLIILVLIPLAFAGTCALGFGGSFLRSLFIK